VSSRDPANTHWLALRELFEPSNARLQEVKIKAVTFAKYSGQQVADIVGGCLRAAGSKAGWVLQGCQQRKVKGGGAPNSSSCEEEQTCLMNSDQFLSIEGNPPACIGLNCLPLAHHNANAGDKFVKNSVHQ